MSSVRTSILSEADHLVNGDRNVSYGDPTADFSRTAELWGTYLRGVAARQDVIGPADVAVMMILLKISRLAWSPDKRDSWVDIAGYAACGADCAEQQWGLK